ncbi:hypothetical protein KPL70_003376 [Citrus sinensis]|nr:hypothetical protein KPL70_003376 [Citrus sinensis]
MARFDHHKQHTYTKTGCWFLCVLGLLGAALIADFMWASSSSSFSSSSAHLSVASNWALEKSGVVVIPHVNATKIDRQRKSVAVIDKKGQDAERFLSATFADLPAPDLEWEQMPSAPVPRLDGAAIQIKNLFYVFAGYGSLDYVHSHVDVYNFTDNKWVDRFDMPKDMAHSHLGVVSDGRYIYIVSGQYGPQCRGPTSRTFVLDSETRKWDSMPPLPSPSNSVMEGPPSCDGWQQRESPHTWIGALEYCSKGWKGIGESMED